MTPDNEAKVPLRDEVADVLRLMRKYLDNGIFWNRYRVGPKESNEFSERVDALLKRAEGRPVGETGGTTE